MSAQDVITEALDQCADALALAPDGGVYVEGTIYLDAWAKVAIDALTAAGYAVVKLPAPGLASDDQAIWHTDYLTITQDGSGEVVINDELAIPESDLPAAAAALLAAAKAVES